MRSDSARCSGVEANFTPRQLQLLCLRRLVFVAMDPHELAAVASAFRDDFVSGRGRALRLVLNTAPGRDEPLASYLERVAAGVGRGLADLNPANPFTPAALRRPPAPSERRAAERARLTKLPPAAPDGRRAILKNIDLVRNGPMAPKPAGDGARAVLLACDSEPRGSVWDGVLEVVERWARDACALYVLDAHHDPDFREQVFRRKARYVSDATRLEPHTLFQAIPALAAQAGGI